jgi:hypothetical protein
MPKTSFPWSCILRRITVAAVVFVWTSPPADAEEPVSADHAARMFKSAEMFKSKIRPVLQQHCLDCHGGGSTEAKFDLSDRAALLKGGDSGAAVVVGKGDASRLIHLLRHSKDPHMPHEADKLPEKTIADICEWIDYGAAYDEPLVAPKGKTASWKDRTPPAEARKFWSYQPLAKVQPPAVKNEAWCRTPIDRFILAKLEAAGLSPRPPAAPAVVARRLSFDLVGLPLTPEDLTEIEKNPSPQSLDRLTAKLLASPQHGERWARHWLDLARFAESHGFEHDYDRPTAYHYRDFVIRAFNEDLPYNQFVRWQIAGDEYRPEDPFALCATGFLAAGVHSTQITKNEVEKHRYDELDDMSATIGTAMLGLTVGCARCHDHKFDPIPQGDYYRLLSTFTTTVRSEIEFDPDPAATKKAQASYQKSLAPLERARDDYEKTQLPAQLAAWEAANRWSADATPWLLLEVESSKSTGGATFTRLPDGSLLAGGANAEKDEYILQAKSQATGVRSLRVEALADPSMVKGGPGRAENGNFALSEVRITAAPIDGSKPAKELTLRKPRATFEQKGLPVQATIDENPTSSWAVDPQFGKDQAASFEFDPVSFPGGVQWTVTLRFAGNKGHNIGRVRLALSSLDGLADLRAAAIPESIPAILRTPSAQRSDAQKKALLHWYRTIDAGWRMREQALAVLRASAPKPKLVKALIATEGMPAIRLHTQGADYLPATHFLRRGDVDQKDGAAPQGFLQVLLRSPDEVKRWQAPPPTGSKTSHRRKALAEWLTDVDHGAGPLLARVIVNRLWQHHLGRGIGATPSDFGDRGERPTHPELLDWLAGELIRNGWRLKPIHQMILASAVYRQSSDVDADAQRIDPDNKLLWHWPRRRLEAEVIRDSILAVSGSLDPTLYGPGTLDPASSRRSIYFTVKRSQLISMMQVFDAPDGLSPIADRATTTIAPQALYLMNNPAVLASAGRFAQRVAPAESIARDQAVRAAYRWALSREPQPVELTESLRFLDRQTASYQQSKAPRPSQSAMTDLCQAILCLNEFVFVE